MNVSLENSTAARDWTAREIAQQPAIWAQALATIDSDRAAIDAWLQPLLARPDMRIVLTGAGSSAYIGEALAPVLTRALGRHVEAISTTSIVGAPDLYLLRDKPTLLVSFGRSGSSPESVGAFDLVNRLVDDPYHLVVCCNPASALARAGERDPRVKCLFMPGPALDQSFAMTSSFTSMLVSAFAVFAPDAAMATAGIAAAQRLIDASPADVERLVASGFRRVAFLGAGGLLGIATEAALKMLELSAGAIDTYAESPLGFRHGPKFVIDDRTLVVLLPGTDAYTRQYDDDLCGELERDGTALTIVRLDQLPALQGVALDQIWQGLVYLIWCQLLAYHNAVSRGINPDNPSPDGQVNRVVQGVVIHPFPARQ